MKFLRKPKRKFVVIEVEGGLGNTLFQYAAAKYLGNAEATGGSDWRKYMHPKYQRRIFFPDLWSEEELKNWGENV